jgi:hypothetical protein
MNPTRTITASALLLPLIMSAQTAQEERTVNALGQTVTVLGPATFSITPPMSEWPEAIEEFNEDRERREVDKRRELPVVVAPEFLDEADGALQTAPATRIRRAPLVQWAGQSGTGIPPDPTGAAGTDRYVQAVNTSYRVYQKTGTGVGAAHNLSTLWAGSANEGDPIVMYDRHAERWFISQFNSGPNRMLIAVSQTSDPAGAYYAYSYTFSQFPDYPKFSIWWDGYYMTSNSNKTAVVFEREQMLAGNPNARMVALSANGIINAGFTCVMPADADGDLPPNGTPCYFFNMEDNSWGAPQDRIKIFEMSTNWVTTANTQVTQSQTLATAPFDPLLGNGFSNIPQSGSTWKLDAGLGYFYYRAQHTRWPDHNSIVLSHGVDVGSNHCGIRWYELRDANDGNWIIYQQGTWNPDAADRYQGSIGMDNQGNIALAYNASDDAAGTFAGLRYTGRLASDPLGQMTFVEESVISGTTFQEGTDRFGDYTHLALDPDGETFWCTGEYLGTGGNPRTRIWSFNLNGQVGVEEEVTATPGLSLESTLQGDGIAVRVEGAFASATCRLEVIGLDGKRVIVQEVGTVNGAASLRLNTSPLAAGVWFVRLVNGEQQRVQRLVIPSAK